MDDITPVQERHLNGSMKAAKDVLLGTRLRGLAGMSTQSASSVNITGGSIVSGSARFGDAVNYTAFEANGTLVMSGSATVYDDLVMPFFVAKTGTSNIPTWSALIGNINAYTFQENDFLEVTTELLHSYKEGSNIEMHVHWVTNGAHVDNRYVKWELEYSIANMTTGGFTSASVVSNETLIPANTPSKTHVYTSINVIDGTGLKIGAQLMCRVRRIPALNGSAPSANPYGLSCGGHYQMDTLGSRQPTIK